MPVALLRDGGDPAPARGAPGELSQRGMEPLLAATAYLATLSCPRVDADALVALRAFADRRRDFGQAS